MMLGEVRASPAASVSYGRVREGGANTFFFWNGSGPGYEATVGAAPPPIPSRHVEVVPTLATLGRFSSKLPFGEY